MNVLPLNCPLTELENFFRTQQGLPELPEGFNAYYIYGHLFPAEYTPVVGILMGVLRHAIFESTKTFIFLVAILAILALSTFLIVCLSACFFKKLTDAWNGVSVPWDHLILVFLASTIPNQPL